MQQLRATAKAVPHGFAIGNGDCGDRNESPPFHVVRQTPCDVTDNFLNRDLPSIAQSSGDGFDSLAPFVLVALLEIIALLRQLISQARCDVADPSCFEW